MAADREILIELLQAALGELDEGIAVLDAEAIVVLWNRNAAAISGYQASEMLSRSMPVNFFELNTHHHPLADARRPIGLQPGTRPGAGDPERRGVERPTSDRPALVQLRHKLGHSLPAMIRRTPLRDELGKRFGMLLRFHPIEEIDSLPHGNTDTDNGHEHRIEESQADMEDRLDEAWHDWSSNGVPFGLLWINVDQAATLRKTHGRDASEAMLTILERTMLHGLRPTEILSRWGTHEFLVISHERTAEMLETHARHIASLAQTADFRWWGDRVPLTVSIGAAQASESEQLRLLLEHAQKGMQISSERGGNQVVLSGLEGGVECSQS
jgi:diguanylate cyclase (GGDEF)-like protein/PAS domain S-box-containing protein